MKKQLLLLTLLLSAATAFAVEHEIDGLWYELVSKTKEAKIIQYKNNVKYSGDIVIPDAVEYGGDTYSVTNIGENAFSSCDLISVTIGNSVKSIGSSAFESCRGLTSVTIPNSVTSIEKMAFFDCGALNSVHISDIEAWCSISFIYYNSNPLSYAHHLYFNGEEIKELVIPNSVTRIGNNAFDGCNSLTSVMIPNSVTSIGNSAFSGCGGLTSITIPNSVTSIGNNAFSGCSGLTSVIIPNSVTTIENGVFSDCRGLTSVTISNSVTSIGNGAFSGCSGLTSVMIPNSVTTIGEDAFSGCNVLTSVTLGNSVKSIGSNAFAGCSGLTSVMIPNSVTSIGYYAFKGCSGLISITIGSGVTSIYSQAFAKCPDLADVYCYAESVPSTNTSAFNDSYIEYATLHVPTASIDAYKSVEPWKNFKTIVGLDGTLPDTPEHVKCATPTISYAEGKVVLGCETEGVTFVSEIKNGDVKKHYDAELTLTPTYVITVYATKTGYDDSDVVMATIQWREGRPVFTGFSSVETDEQTVNDVNGDGEVGIGDIVNITNVMANSGSRGQTP